MTDVYDFEVIGVIGSDPTDAQGTGFVNSVARCVTTVEGPQIESWLDQRHVDMC